MDLSLDDVCEFINGGAWSDDEYADEGIRVVKVTNMRNGTISDEGLDHLPASKYEKYKRHELRPNDLVVATVGSHPNQPGSVVGRTSRIPASFGGAFLNQNAACLRVKRPDLVDQRFLWFLSETVLFKHHIESRARGSANQVRMAIGDLRQFTISYPPLPTQRKIAAVLAAYDDLIEANRRRIALLERMAEEIYREWFVRLRFPGHAATKSIKGIPEGWSVRRIGDVFKTGSGGTPPRQNAANYSGTIPWVKTGELKSTFVFDTEEMITEVGIENSSAKVFPRHTIVIAMYCAMPDISILAAPAATNQACCAFFPKNEFYHYSYSYLLIKFAQKHLINFAHGAAQQNLSQDLIKGFQLLIPTERLITAYGNTAKPLFEQVELLMRQNAHLTRTRDLLLPRLISGKLPVESLPIAFPPSMANAVE